MKEKDSGWLVKRKREKTAFLKLEGELRKTPSTLGSYTPCPPAEAGWVELGAEGSGQGSTLLPRSPHSHSPQP